MNKSTTLLERPLVILGAARSGTTLLAESILAKHPAIAYWNEPSYVWSHGHAYENYDTYPAEWATGRISEHIRERFHDHLVASGKSRFMEKTPANTLRLPFVMRVLPDAKVVHVIRDGRDVALSAAKEWRGEGGGALDSKGKRQAPFIERIRATVRDEVELAKRLRTWRDLMELPAYSRRFVGFIRRQMFNSTEVPWGPRFPGIKDLRGQHSLLETCAVQWDTCVRRARDASRSLRTDQYMELKYEDLTQRPQETVAEVLDFADLDSRRRLIEELTERVVLRPVPRWPSHATAEEIKSVERLSGGTLLDLGYRLRNHSPEGEAS